MADEKAAKRVKILAVKRKPVTRPVEVPDGIYLYHPDIKTVTRLTKRVSVYGDIEYAYAGPIPSGPIELVTVLNGEKIAIPSQEGWNHGYTLEGTARNHFHVSDAIVRYQPIEDRSFAYVHPGSALRFVGGEGKTFEISARLFKEGEEGPVRWVVFHLSEK